MEDIPVPELNGLILAGGMSTRMGVDKSKLDYHGMPQYQYLSKLLSMQVAEVFISCRRDQQFDGKVNVLVDEFEDIGPLSGVLTAFHAEPTFAWFVVACDLPYVNEEAISHLIASRIASKQATYFIDPETNFPEPLLTLFEPSILPLLLHSFHAGQFSLNKILQGCEGNPVVPKDARWLRSVNTREEMVGYKKGRS